MHEDYVNEDKSSLIAKYSSNIYYKARFKGSFISLPEHYEVFGNHDLTLNFMSRIHDCLLVKTEWKSLC